MKRIAIVIGILLMATNAMAGLITFDSSAVLTRSYLNNTFSTIIDEMNGSIDTDNLASSAVTSNDIATAVNPLVRDAENIGEYVYTGLLPPTATGLASTTTAGTAYVENDGDDTLHRVVKAATAKTYTASKDTYVYLDFTGTYSYEEVANNAAQPTTPDNSILLAKVVTDATDVSSVTDLRQTTPANLRIYLDYARGCTISRDADDVDKINITRGEIELASTDKVRRNTSSTSVNFGTTGRGALDTGSLAANQFYYVFAVADDDNSTNFECIASISSTDATGVTGERLIGWCYPASSSIISPDSVGGYKGRGEPFVNVASVSVDSTTVNGATPAYFKDMMFYTSGGTCRITFTGTAVANNSALNIGFADYRIIDAATLPLQDFAVVAGSDTNSVHIEWVGKLSSGEHIIKLKAHEEGTSSILWGRLTIQEL